METVTQPCSGVVIGGSAGALDALNIVLPLLPARFMPPVIVVVHQLSSGPNLLPGLFALRCAMPVHEAEDKLAVQPGHLYLAPPDYHLLLEQDPDTANGVRLALSVDPPVRFSRPSIDVLFESAASVWRARTLGVLLSGANDDGVRGLALIRAAGGRAWVQAPQTAVVDTMPQEAIARGAADRALTLEAIGHGLARLNE